MQPPIRRCKLIFAALGAWLASAECVRAEDPVVSFPAAGNFRAAQGTIEMWFRLEEEPDGSQTRSLHYFPIFTIQVRGEQIPRVRVTYQTIWKPDWFHLFFASVGRAEGEMIQNPYVTTVEDTQASTKADTASTGPYPRAPRLHCNEWHHLAVTWAAGLTKPTVAMYLDGREVIRPIEIPAVWWDDMEATSLILARIPYHDNISVDELRISDIAGSPERIAGAFAAGGLTRDEHTLLLDHFDQVITDECSTEQFTLSEQISGYEDEPGGKILSPYWEITQGRFGNALRTIAKARNL